MDTQLLGGGIPLGYVLSVVQDDPTVYWKLFAKFFCAEGLESEHKILLIGRGANALSKEIPESTDSQEKANVPGKRQNEEQLKIAWAYQKQPMGRVGMQQIPGTNRFGHLYDVSTSRNFESISNCVTIIDPEDSSSKEHFHERIIQGLERIKDDSSSVWRVCFLDFGGMCYPQGSNLSKLLLKIRLLSASKSPANHTFLLTTQRCVAETVCRFSDAQYELENFLVKESQFKSQFDGTIEVKKMVQVGLKPFQQSVATFGFKLKRKKFTIEPLHLPPDFDEGKTRDGEDNSYQSACSSMPSESSNSGCCGGGSCDF
ncbi:Oidioi.mRNA.OKI2018_I69.chr1.g2739.t1.cds [Oikopleura dioica]|uniref:Elongator complex protein 4 n=1 Tax=Oikopleura dioica TaxID=34765 RepID=A0ABN7SVW9_OIKDI|nr:Oidioi.mRNA.OKI2018_I69.chr1.g2739.t1.cds [Oikopleura dioica]